MGEAPPRRVVHLPAIRSILKTGTTMRVLSSTFGTLMTKCASPWGYTRGLRRVLTTLRRQLLSLFPSESQNGPECGRTVLKKTPEESDGFPTPL